MKAIDLYAGVGGWSIGLKLAGFEVVESFEWWQPAADTHVKNLDGKVRQVNIRELDLASLPREIDVVVGSPPCTQFSYSNRGGSGNVADGLEDLYAFLRVVEYLKPKHWAFENVPRVKNVIEKARTESGRLQDFQHLLKDCVAVTVDMSDFGVPQRRQRCIVGNFSQEQLLSLSLRSKPKSLGYIVETLKTGREPLYSHSARTEITDNDPEARLNWEEVRFNSDMKLNHPIYNGMSFPDRPDRPSRTVTATCTRVSRESIIYGEQDGSFRRLSVRERACLQSFPASYQFHGKSHAEKLKMVGNAIPPYFTYQMGQLFKGNLAPSFPEVLSTSKIIKPSEAPKTLPDRPGRVYPADRRFRFAIPGLNFKSGTRFELNNAHGSLQWKIDFFFGNSKHIARLELNDRISRNIHSIDEFKEIHAFVAGEISKICPANLSSLLQDNWVHVRDDLHPFDLLDMIAKIVPVTIDLIEEYGNRALWEKFAVAACEAAAPGLPMKKIQAQSLIVAAGIILGCCFNEMEKS